MGKILATIGLATVLGVGSVFAGESKVQSPETTELKEPAPLIQKATPEMVDHIRDYEIVRKLSLLDLSYDIDGFLMLIDPGQSMVMLAIPVDIERWGTPERAANAFMEEFPYIYAGIHYDEERKMHFGVFINISKYIANNGLTDPNNLVDQLLGMDVDEQHAKSIAEEYYSLFDRVKILESKMSSIKNQSPLCVPKGLLSPIIPPSKIKWDYPSNRISVGFNNSTKVPSADIAIALAKNWAVELGAKYSNDEMSNMAVNEDYDGIGVYTSIGFSYRSCEYISLLANAEGLWAKKNDNSKYSYTIVPSTVEAGIDIMIKYFKLRLTGEKKVFGYFPYDEKISPSGDEYTGNVEASWRFKGITFIEWTVAVENIHQENGKTMANAGAKIGVVW